MSGCLTRRVPATDPRLPPSSLGDVEEGEATVTSDAVTSPTSKSANPSHSMIPFNFGQSSRSTAAAVGESACQLPNGVSRQTVASLEPLSPSKLMQSPEQLELSSSTLSAQAPSHSLSNPASAGLPGRSGSGSNSIDCK